MKNKKSLLIFCHQFQLIDGATRTVKNILDSPAFNGNLHKITIVSPTDGYMRGEFAQIKNVEAKVIPYDVVSFKIHWLSPVKTLRNYIRGSLTLIQLIKVINRSDLAWVNTIAHPKRLFKLLSKKNCKTLYYFHEALGEYSFDRWRINEQNRQLLLSNIKEAGSKIVFPSKSTAEQGQNLFGRESVDLLPYGFIPPVLSPVRSKYNNGTVHFIVVGAICARKGQEFIPYAFKAVEEEIKRDSKKYFNWRLSFLGVNFPDEADRSFMHLANNVLDPGKISFLESIPHKRVCKELLSYDCLISNSFNEALPLNVIEMMLTGGLVIGTDCEGQNELILEGETGRIYKKGNIAGLKEAILKVLDIENEQLNCSMGLNGYKRIVDHYKYDTMIKNIIKYFQ